MVMEGYKQTDVGVIPKDWSVTELKHAVEFLDGQRKPVKSGDRAKMQGIFPYYGASGIVDYVSDYIFDGDFILLGEDGENILSRNLPLAFRVSGKIWVNNHAHVLKPRAGYNIDFLTAFLESRDYALHNSGTAQPKLNKQTCESLLIAEPTLIEQQAIANALSDVDALIEHLEKLIAKKRDIKTGTMQQLLTGKKRLPGFGEGKGTKQTELGGIPEDWDVTALSSLCSMKSGETITAEHISSDGVYPCYGGNGLRGRTNKFTHEGEFALVGRQGALCGNVSMAKGKFFASEHAIVVTPNQNTDIFWLGNILRDMNLNQYSESSAQPGLTVSKLLYLKVVAPGLREEQQAISQTLSDMESEVGEIEKRFTKVKAIKQGMMQELLTGRTRLV